jgi:hypothetical protein
MLDKTLTPVEKKRLNRSINVASALAQKVYRSELQTYVMRERTRLALKILGARHPDSIMVGDGLQIIKDHWPFKIRRLRKLINE